MFKKSLLTETPSSQKVKNKNVQSLAKNPVTKKTSIFYYIIIPCVIKKF